MISYEAFRAEFKTAVEAFDKACQMAEIAAQLGDEQGVRAFIGFATRIRDTEWVHNSRALRTDLWTRYG